MVTRSTTIKHIGIYIVGGEGKLWGAKKKDITYINTNGIPTYKLPKYASYDTTQSKVVYSVGYGFDASNYDRIVHLLQSR